MSERFTASRAFAVEEFEDEGSHYFVDLTDNRVLFLSGQYLYDYEPLEDAEETFCGISMSLVQGPLASDQRLQSISYATAQHSSRRQSSPHSG